MLSDEQCHNCYAKPLRLQVRVNDAEAIVSCLYCNDTIEKVQSPESPAAVRAAAMIKRYTDGAMTQYLEAIGL